MEETKGKGHIFNTHYCKITHIQLHLLTSLVDGSTKRGAAYIYHSLIQLYLLNWSLIEASAQT